MRRLFLILALLSPLSLWAGTCGNGYSFSKEIVLQKAVGTDQTNFVYDMVLNDARFKTVANGGQVQNTANNSIGTSGPADFIVCDAASAGNSLKFEVPFYDGTNGIVELHFLKATLHTASQDSVWVFTNNAAVVTSQQDLSFWATAGYIAVYHFPDGSTLNLKDSTGSFDGTNHSTTATAGLFDGGLNLGGSPQNVTTSLPTSAINNIGTELWINYDGLSQVGILYEIGSGGNGYNTGIINGGCNASQTIGIVFEGVGCGAGGAGFFMRTGWHYVAWTRDTTTINLYGDSLLVFSGTPGTPNVPTTRGTIGSTGGNAAYATTKLDELRQFSGSPKSNDFFSTASRVGHWATPYLINEPATYTVPTIRQFNAQCTSGASVSASVTCPTVFPVTLGGVIVLTVSDVDNDCTTGFISSSSLGLTYTMQVSSDYTGTFHHYYTCIFTAPITTTGFESVVTSAGNISMAIYELKGATVTGIATASAGNNTQPSSFSATSPSSNSIMFGALTGDDTNVSATTTPSYTIFQGQQVNDSHGAAVQVVSPLVGSGSQSLQFNAGANYATAGPGGVLVIIPFTAPPSSAVRHRVINQ
jgi:hypothetical protein